MKQTTIGIIREGKVPPDFRTPLTPNQCEVLEQIFPNVKIKVQSSPIRTYKDEEYQNLGIEVVTDLTACDLIFGVKEVQIEDLIPNKTFVFFSHTLKKQPYNRALLQAILHKNIRLIDYEAIRDKQQKRLVGFGRYAGIVGCYNGFLTYGLKTQTFTLKPANQCEDRKEVEREMKKVILPNNFRAVITGFGRVGHGAKEIIDLLPIKEVSPEEFLENKHNEAVYCQLDSNEYYQHVNGHFNKGEFYENPSEYVSILPKFLAHADMYIPCHFWNNRAPNLLSQSALIENRRLKVVADISCDIAGPIACTIRPSKISDPIYGYLASTGKEVDWRDEDAIAVMAVDNLPCELPKDASEDFGSELVQHVFPVLLGDDPDQIIHHATETTFEGALNDPFLYLTDYLKGI